MMRRTSIYIWLILCLAPFEASFAARHASIIVDTSGSMKGNDPPRYTVLVTEILADLMNSGDSLTVIRLPQDERGCDNPANDSLTLHMNQADRADFQNRIDQILQYNTGTHFAAAVHTAQADLEQHKDQARLLLFIADSGGLGGCNRPLTEDLKRLREQGVMIAAINLGGRGAFDSNPAFAFTIGVRDSQALAKSVAEVYQKFIGAKQVLSGRGAAKIEIEVDAFVREAFLVVVADGNFETLKEDSGNPGAESVDLDYKGGGRVTGVDQRVREYKIVRLLRPRSGAWRFLAPDLRATAGWMLLQDSALQPRLISQPKAAQDVVTPIEVEIFDQDSGKRLDNPSAQGLKVTADVEGDIKTFRDDGQSGDKMAGDGIFTAPVRFKEQGKRRIRLHLESKILDRTLDQDIDVQSVGSTLKPNVPERVEVDRATEVTVEVSPNPDNILPPEPVQRIEMYLDGNLVATLGDDGQAVDRQARDNLYSGVWTPDRIGDFSIELRPVGGGRTPSASARVKVIGGIRFGKVIPIHFGRTHGNSEASGRLELGADTLIKGEVPVALTGAFDASGSVLEIDLGQGWTALDDHPLALVLKHSGQRSWPLRVRVGDCPEGVAIEDTFTIDWKLVDAQGQISIHRIPLTIEIVEDPWLHCWWPLLVGILLILVAAFVVYGFWWPSRFSRNLGVVLSPEVDMNEGFFHAIRAQSGTRSGFYRHARAYIHPDFRISGRSRGAIARLGARPDRLSIRPESGNTVYRQNLEGEWEALPTDESAAHFGVIYKDSLGALFFEIRNG